MLRRNLLALASQVQTAAGVQQVRCTALPVHLWNGPAISKPQACRMP
jgi:hypothetical protein